MTFEELARLVEQVQTDLAFARIVREESRRTVLCRPEDVTRIRWLVDQAGMDDVLTVSESLFLPVGQMFVIDDQAIEAGLAEAIDEHIRREREKARNRAMLLQQPWLLPPTVLDPKAMLKITGY